MFELSKAVAVVQQDLTRACYHEAAHCAVAFHFGVHGHWRVWPTTNEASINLQITNSFEGRFYPFNSPADEHVSRMIGLAGVIAELLLEDELVEGWEIDEYLSFGTLELSETDAAAAGDFNESDLSACLNIVKSLWPTIKQEAEWRAKSYQDEVLELAKLHSRGYEEVNHV